ncbi:MAG: VWA domain-containing protein [Deltaproteobacteria bacterium]|jgi:uncharacterized protein YegL|nr:VWA domain-containing protein [Deltaproteobacteria bacterium]
MLRRRPLYLLLDVSESMIGSPLESVEEGVRRMAAALRRDPVSMEILHVSVITFAARAEVAVPLSELGSFVLPRLEVRPGTALGAALKLCRESIAKDVRRSTPESKGDYRPLVFVMTDGEPTDGWRDAARELREGRPGAEVIAVGCGDEADFDVLREISGQDAVRAEDLSGESVLSLFRWVSGSLAASTRASGGGRVDLSKVPMGRGITLVKKEDPAPVKARARIFLHVTCCGTGKKYLAVYRAPAEGQSCYSLVGTHALPGGFYSDGEARASALTGVSLDISPACPWCGADAIFICGECRTCYCFRYGAATFDCPGCRKTLQVSYGASGGTNIFPSRG